MSRPTTEARPRQHRWVVDVVVLAGFALTGLAIASLLPSAAIGVTFLAAGFVSLVVSGVTRDVRAGILLGAALVVFAGTAMTYGPALAKVVPL